MTPALLHWKPGHFSVLAGREADGRYRIEDPAANLVRIVTAETLEEASGACLVVAADLPAGWRDLSRSAAEAAIGRSTLISPDDGCNEGCKSCNGMAEADFNLFRASLVISDTPLVDTPPRGEGLSVHATWSQHTTSLVHTLSYPKLGTVSTQWTLGSWSYVDEDSTGGGGSRIVFDEVGNRITHTWNGSTFNRQLLSLQTLEKVYSGSTFQGFRLRSEDGSYEEYFQPGKEVPVPVEDRRYFLTKRVDAQGITTCTLTYESSGLQRLSTITGVPGTASLTFNYAASSGATAYNVSTIVDSRSGGSRTVTFSYIGSGSFLSSIQDVVGITSSFGYVSGFLTSLVTPYGTSYFNSVVFSTGNFGRYLDLTDARGWTPRVLFAQFINAGYAGDATLSAETPASVPLAANTGLNAGASWHWDKKMFVDYPPGNPAVGNYTSLR